MYNRSRLSYGFGEIPEYTVEWMEVSYLSSNVRTINLYMMNAPR